MAYSSLLEQMPNLFSWATSELSQDAFIAWLLQWSEVECCAYKLEPELYKGSRIFLSKLLGIDEKDLPEIHKGGLCRQWNNIDIVMETEKHLLLIEDKRGAMQHGNQLERYLKIASDYLQDNNKQKQIVPIYLQTHNQAGLFQAEHHGWRVFNRADFLDCLREIRNLGVENNILIDFQHYLGILEFNSNKFKNLPLEKWVNSADAWRGFFTALEKEEKNGQKVFPDFHWEYVSNRSGGFEGAWWHWQSYKEGHDAYLQIEEQKLCVKLRGPFEDNEQKRVNPNLRWELLNALEKTADNFGITLHKAKRFAPGKWVTVAIIGHDTEWLKCEENGSLDLPETIDFLIKCSDFLDQAIQS